MSAERQKNPEETGIEAVEPGKEISDKKLIEAAQNGDTRAFGRLIRRHQKKLFRFIAALTGSFDQADDIVQEAFVRAWQNLRKFRTEYDFYPWLSTIARNLAYNELRKQEKSQSLDQMKEAGFNPVDKDLGPLDRLMNGQAQKRFYEALWAMPVLYRTVFVLRHFENMDYAQIGSYLKIPPGTVDSRLYRARRYLLEKLQDLLE
ncbi:sigma-70 family RNA polymerase sigma factor [candidate division GN15 bacterium]|nr:sigma-70 family RNA polymerase sigma factor [candidate division GN15 bacterium]